MGRLTLGELRRLTEKMPDETEIDLDEPDESRGVSWGGAEPAKPCPDDETVIEPPRVILVPEIS